MMPNLTESIISSLIQQAANGMRRYSGVGGFKLDGALSARMAEDGSQQED